MAEATIPLIRVYDGWPTYQQQIVEAIAPLTDEQLAVRAAPHLRTIEEIATHLIRVRVSWFHDVLNVGGDDFTEFGDWDRSDMPRRSAGELVRGLESTWRTIAGVLNRWDVTVLEDVLRGSWHGEPYEMTRRWVIWHVMEHDLHHGGEISLTLGIHRLKAPDI
ncbi:MAG: DinB family protein [Ktedonobacterales bacterium]